MDLRTFAKLLFLQLQPSLYASEGYHKCSMKIVMKGNTHCHGWWHVGPGLCFKDRQWWQLEIVCVNSYKPRWSLL